MILSVENTKDSHHREKNVVNIKPLKKKKDFKIFHMKPEIPQVMKAILSKNNDQDITFPDFKTYFKVTVIIKR